VTDPTSADDLRDRLSEHLERTMPKSASGYQTYLQDELYFGLAGFIEAEVARLTGEAAEWKRAAEAEAQGRTADVTLMVRDLHAAQFDGATSLPDRPLDTVWEWLLDLVRKDRARLSGGNTPADAAGVVLATPNSAGAGDRIRVTYIDDVVEEGVVVASRPAGRNFVDFRTDDGEMRHGVHVYEILARAPGWGSAVATPADTQAGELPEFCHEAHGNYERSTPMQIKEWLEHRKLSTEGTKAELIARLRADDAHPAHQCGCCPRVARSRCEPWCPRSLVWLSRDPAPSAGGADTEDEREREAREDAEDRETADAIVPDRVPRMWVHGRADNPPRPDPHGDPVTVRNKTGKRWKQHGNQWRAPNSTGTGWGFWGLLEMHGPLTEDLPAPPAPTERTDTDA